MDANFNEKLVGITGHHARMAYISAQTDGQFSFESRVKARLQDLGIELVSEEVLSFPQAGSIEVRESWHARSLAGCQCCKGQWKWMPIDAHGHHSRPYYDQERKLVTDRWVTFLVWKGGENEK